MLPEVAWLIFILATSDIDIGCRLGCRVYSASLLKRGIVRCLERRAINFFTARHSRASESAKIIQRTGPRTEPCGQSLI